MKGNRYSLVKQEFGPCIEPWRPADWMMWCLVTDNSSLTVIGQNLAEWQVLHERTGQCIAVPFETFDALVAANKLRRIYPDPNVWPY
jgi:hypothetical protein